VAHAGPRRRRAGVHLVVRGRHHPFGQAVEDRDLHAAPLAVGVALPERRERRGERVDAGTDVADGDAHLHRLVGRAGHPHDPTLRLEQEVVGLAVAVRAVGAVSRDAHAHQARPALVETLPAEAETLERARPEVVHEDVGTPQEPVERGAIGRSAEVERDAALAAVKPDEVGGLAAHHRVVAAREVAFGPLDLDDVGAHVGQMARAERARDGLLERHYANPIEGSGHTAILGTCPAAPLTALNAHFCTAVTGRSILWHLAKEGLAR